jgi:excisionase family DNA binding protein
MMTALSQRVTLSIDDAISAMGIGKTMLYELLNNGSIRSITVGKKRLIIVQSLYDFVAAKELSEALKPSTKT